MELVGFKALAFLIKDSARKSRDPLIGRVMPKGMEYLERYE